MAPGSAVAPGSSSTGSGIVTMWRTDESVTGMNATEPADGADEIVG